MTWRVVIAFLIEFILKSGLPEKLISNLKEKDAQIVALRNGRSFEPEGEDVPPEGEQNGPSAT